MTNVDEGLFFVSIYGGDGTLILTCLYVNMLLRISFRYLTWFGR